MSTTNRIKKALEELIKAADLIASEVHSRQSIELMMSQEVDLSKDQRDSHATRAERMRRRLDAWTAAKSGLAVLDKYPMVLTVNEAYEAACKAYNDYSADQAPLTWGQYLRACLNEKLNTEAPPPPAAGLTVEEVKRLLRDAVWRTGNGKALKDFYARHGGL
jgi:hypothetical protein